MPQLKYVLDASAVLAVLNNEPGAQIVIPLLPNSIITSVNLTEVATKLIDAAMPLAAAQVAISVLGIGEIRDFDKALAWKAAGLRPLTKSLGLSLGDRCCLALGVQAQFEVVTADKEWAKLSICKITVIR